MVLIPFLLRVAALTILAVLSTHVHASTSIIVPWSVTAGQPEDLKIVLGTDADPDIQKKYDGYRVFLALEPPGWGTGPECWLAYAVDLATTQVNVTIPADVAPDKSRVRISTSLIKKDTKGSTGYSYSSRTTLLGANGTWSQRELDGWVIDDANRVSCWALGCARRCYERHYTGDRTHPSDGSGDGEADDCVDQCIKDLNPRGAASANMTPKPLVYALMAGVAVGILHVVL